MWFFDNYWFFISGLQDLSLKAAESTKRDYEEGNISCLVIVLVEVSYAQLLDTSLTSFCRCLSTKVIGHNLSGRLELT